MLFLSLSEAALGVFFHVFIRVVDVQYQFAFHGHLTLRKAPGVVRCLMGEEVGETHSHVFSLTEIAVNVLNQFSSLR